jgi:transcriptional regulator with GAF, ATPase, and Fis domain
MPVAEIERAVIEDFGRLASLLDCDSCNFHMFDQHKQNWLAQFELSEKVFLWVRHERFAKELKEFRSHPDFARNMGYMFERWDRGEYATCPTGESSKKAERMERFASILGISSFVSVPIFAAGVCVGAIIVADHGSDVVWPHDIVPKLRLFGEILTNALLRKKSEEALHSALAEVKRLKDQIEADYFYLREEINLEHGFPEVVGSSQTLQQILVKVKQVAPTNASVLLTGETGTGKGVIARAIHNASGRSNRPLIQVNCAALAPGLIESDLFGHEKGAFTGAVARRAGRFEMASGSTLFLDEIGELPLDLQAKLLRVIQEGEFERVGGTTTLKTDVRIIAATNKDLHEEVDNGRFRSDLWYRLSVFPISMPPLRERIVDIPFLINHFVSKHEKKTGKRFETLSQKAMKSLQSYPWPGNIRELENFIERAIITSTDGHLQFEMPSSPHTKNLLTEKRKFGDAELKCLMEALSKTNWKIEGPGGAAAITGLRPSTFRLHMRKLGIKRPGST